jgi:hypothetical protein
MTFTSSEQLKCRFYNCASVSGEKSSSTSPPISSRRVLLLYAWSGVEFYFSMRVLGVAEPLPA